MCLQNGSEETAFPTESVAALILEHGQYGTLSKICCNFACPFDDTAEQSTSVGMGAWQRRDNPLGLRGECRSAALIETSDKYAITGREGPDRYQSGGNLSCATRYVATVSFFHKVNCGW